MIQPLPRDHPSYAVIRSAAMTNPKWLEFLQPEDRGVVALPRVEAAEKTQAPKTAPLACPHRGEPTGETKRCLTCSGAMMKIFACSKYGTCTVGKAVAGVHLCDGGSPAV